jgi:hypothetical protein
MVNNDGHIFCRHCHRSYQISDVMGVKGNIDVLVQNPSLLDDPQDLESRGVEIKPWVEVRLPSASKASSGLRFLRGRRKVSEEHVADLLAESYDPYCPKLHFLIDELADAPLFITVAGNVSASKSTYLIGLVAEMLQSATLGPLPLFASIRPSQSAELRRRTKLIYQDNQDLPPTPEETTEKGFVVRLKWPDNSKRNVAFVDVSGEVIRDEVKAAKGGRFLYSSDGIILLIDPGGFPDPKGWMKPIDPEVELATADIVNVLADGLEQVTQKPISQLEIPLIVVVAKSDKVAWPDVPAPVSVLGDGTGSDKVAGVLHELQRESDLVRSYLLDKGLEAIVTTAEARFGTSLVRYTKSSALGQGPKDHGLKDTSRKPDGCWKPVALVLKGKGLL